MISPPGPDDGRQDERGKTHFRCELAARALASPKPGRDLVNLGFSVHASGGGFIRSLKNPSIDDADDVANLGAKVGQRHYSRAKP